MATRACKVHLALALGLTLALIPAAAAAPAARPTRRASESASFLGVGDWGGIGDGPAHATAQRAVARGMSAVAQHVGASLVVGVGDNAYSYGFTSATDPRFNGTWEAPYNLPGLATLPWLQAIGNHGYGLEPEAQVQYSSKNPRWIMPARYYTHEATFGAAKVTFVVLDTSPCIKAYRSDNSSGWDPKPNKPNRPAGYNFHANILAQKCTDQLTWLKGVLKDVPKDHWLIGVGHHRADQIDVADLIAPLHDANMRVYLNGHLHTLNYYHLDGKGHHVTTGAGCMVDVADEDEDGDEHSHAPLGTSAHKFAPVWNNKVAGFTSHEFSTDGTKLTTRYFNYTGGELYRFVAAKD